jgi:hypothetical protein
MENTQMAQSTAKAGVDAFSSLAQNLMMRSVQHRMKMAYLDTIKPRLVGEIPPGGGALLYLVTFEPKAVELSSVPQQMIYHHLGLVGVGHDPALMKRNFLAQGRYTTAAPNGSLKRVERFIWVRAHEVGMWG